MLTGLTPFDEENKMKMFDSIANREPVLPSGIDEEAGDLILQILTKDPKGRPGFEEIAAHSFFDCLDWDYVISRRYVPNFVPELKKDKNGKNLYFPPEFTDELPIDSSCEDLPADPLNIEGFSYNAPIVLECIEDDKPIIDSMLLDEYQDFANNDNENY